MSVEATSARRFPGLTLPRGRRSHRSRHATVGDHPIPYPAEDIAAPVPSPLPHLRRHPVAADWPLTCRGRRSPGPVMTMTAHLHRRPVEAACTGPVKPPPQTAPSAEASSCRSQPTPATSLSAEAFGAGADSCCINLLKFLTSAYRCR
jgi:hypothetical protein